MGPASSRFSRAGRSKASARDRRSYARTVKLGEATGGRGHPVQEASRADDRIQPHAGAGAARIAPPGPRAVRSRRAARPDCQPSRQGCAPGGGDQGQPGPASSGGLQRIRDGGARDPRSAGDREGGHHYRLPAGRGVRRTHRHAVPGADPPHAVARAHRHRQRRRDRPARHRGRTLPRHHRAGGGARIGRSAARRRSASQARRRDQTAGRVARGLASGPRTTSRCVPCGGPTPSRKKTSRCATTWRRDGEKKPSDCRSWRPWAATPSCTCGACRRQSARECE